MYYQVQAIYVYNRKKQMVVHHFYKFNVPLTTGAVAVIVLVSVTIVGVATVFVYDTVKRFEKSDTDDKNLVEQEKNEMTSLL